MSIAARMAKPFPYSHRSPIPGVGALRTSWERLQSKGRNARLAARAGMESATFWLKVLSDLQNRGV